MYGSHHAAALCSSMQLTRKEEQPAPPLKPDNLLMLVEDDHDNGRDEQRLCDEDTSHCPPEFAILVPLDMLLAFVIHIELQSANRYQAAMTCACAV